MNEKILEIIEEYKKKIEKECCFINYSDGTPNILYDLYDKIGGIPYLNLTSKWSL